MKISLLSLILLLSCLQDKLSVAPYFLRTDKNEVILKFRAKKAGAILVKVSKNNGEKLYDLKKEFDKKEVVEINLGQQLCDEEMIVLLSSADFPTIEGIEKTIPRYPCEEELVFGIISDTQSNKKRHRNIGEQLKPYNDLSFIVHLGDLVDYAVHQYQWKKFFDQAGPTYLDKTPIVTAVGNHSFYNIFAKWVGKGPVADKFGKYMRWDGSPEIGYINLVFPQFEMIIINSILEKLTGEEIKKQWEWLEERLIEADKAKRPVIVAMHYSPYHSTHPSESFAKIEAILRSKMVPLLEKYKVKLALTGHTHLYERLYKNGVHYIVAGPAGGNQGKFYKKNDYQVLIKPRVDTFGIVSVDKERILIKTLNNKNEVIDSLRIDL